MHRSFMQWQKAVIPRAKSNAANSMLRTINAQYGAQANSIFVA